MISVSSPSVDACLGAPALEPARPKAVALLALPQASAGNLHDRASRDVLLQRLGALMGLPYIGVVAGDGPVDDDLLLVPGDTVSEDDGFPLDDVATLSILGGVVPTRFVGTKAITHPVLDDAARRPVRWSEVMAAELGDAALKGYTAFTLGDAARAGRILLKDGPVRLKDVCAKAGLGQVVVRDEVELDEMLALEDADGLAACGLVLEENLSDVVTYSVGAVVIGDRRISYFGDQGLTTDHKGREVYGGSDLTVVRGGLEQLTALDLPPELARAVDCAAAFDRAAQRAYPDAILTRRNYDVIAGTDAAGQRRVGVLEQSWRIGGASGAELAAFEAFEDDPTLTCVRCSTVERYAILTPPDGATLYFQGEDPVVGVMTKYAMRTA